MSKIEEILKLPKEEQIAILEAIQNNLDEEQNNNIVLNEEQVNYIKQRVEDIKSSNTSTYTWQEMKEKLNSRWNTK